MKHSPPPSKHKNQKSSVLEKHYLYNLCDIPLDPSFVSKQNCLTCTVCQAQQQYGQHTRGRVQRELCWYQVTGEGIVWFILFKYSI